MKAPKLILTGALALFGLITITAVLKGPKKKPEKVVSSKDMIEEIQIISMEEKPSETQNLPQTSIAEAPKVEQIVEVIEDTKAEDFPTDDLIDRLFATDSSKLPIVETLTYTSRVPWLSGRPAWISDYASHYANSRHFIARSLNKKADYFTQKIAPGDRFNVLRTDVNIQFHLVIDLSRCKLFFYCHDLDSNDYTLLKTYSVGLGRKDSVKKSGSLTPIGKYLLGSKIAIYKPGTMGYFQDQKTEMVRIFGTRWIPFTEELENCSEHHKGFGLHGSPWILDANGSLIEDRTHIGKYDSDGCIRLNEEDIEELFAI